MIQAIAKCVVLRRCVLARDNGVVPIAEQRALEREGREGRMQKVGRLRREQGTEHIAMLKESRQGG